MKKIGFIGLGTMGLPMANQLLEAGYELVVCTRSPQRVKQLAKENYQVVSSPAAVAKECEALVTMLLDDVVVEEVLLGEAGVIKGSHPGLIVVDSTTILPETSKRVAAILAEQGVEMLDAPVAGSKPQAEKGELTFMVGGQEETFTKCLSLFSAMGKKAVYMGPSGSGTTVKLAHNLVSAMNLVSLVEGLTLATKAGVESEKFLEVLMGGGAKSAMAEVKIPKIQAREFVPAFKNELMGKDLRLIAAFAESMEVPLPGLALTQELFTKLLAMDLGEEDVCSLIKLYEGWAGLEVGV